MKILWLCNIVFLEFCKLYDIPENTYGGWMSGMLSMIEGRKDIEIALAFPIRDKWRMKDGLYKGHPFFSFNNEFNDTYILRESRKKRLKEIFNLYTPDVVHIWGTEYPWSLEMIEICDEENYLYKTFVHIQGLTSVCAKHYMSGIPENYLDIVDSKGLTIRKLKEEFDKRGKNEIQLIKKVKHIGCRTDWDKACTYAINQNCEYHNIGEVLRNDFYESEGVWKYEYADNHAIFVSQAGYPIKGFHYLIEALRIVVSLYPDTRVYVAGTDITGDESIPAYGVYVSDIIKKYGLINNICFCGKLSTIEMIQRYKCSKVFISASTIENSPNSIAEAMIIGTPVITSYVGGIASIVRNRENMLAYPENETDMLAYYIIECFRDRELCERLSVGGMKTAQAIVSAKRETEKLMALYSVLASN